MFGRQKQGAVICRSCGRLVGSRDARCFHCGARNPGLWGFALALRRFGADLGFTELVIGVCVFLFLVQAVMDPRGAMALMRPSLRTLAVLGASGKLPVFDLGRWWTVLSAGWLHAGVLHIFFNLMWIRQLAPLVADGYGAPRMVIVYIVSSVTGFALSTAVALSPPIAALLHGGELSVGASAAIFGLFAALIYYGRRGGSSHLSSQIWGLAVLSFVLGFVVDGVDNWAHLGGFLGGYATARILDPLKPERLNHLVLALALLLATAASLLASVLIPLEALAR
ncbi:MAG TPA: rhomboid family intramembrane serine protease [Thermoanaerobaculia bacterium]|nr:rhomboid family intramembrane serine protease [Thermoanaerobaculia bacterium]